MDDGPMRAGAAGLHAADPRVQSASDAWVSAPDWRSLPLFAHGFSLRKRAFLRRFLARDDIRFVRSARAVPERAAMLLWGRNCAPEGLPANVRVVRVEDGFLRSVGLGADLARPLSWVFDARGIYFDASHASDLETMLRHASFDADELQRAARLRECIVQHGLSKYNLAGTAWRPRAPAGSQVVLVAGQVEDDASVQTGAVNVRRNAELLRAVREARPDAWVVYKPHPDVVAGLRHGGGAQECAALCDEWVDSGSAHEMLARVDEVHVITSLLGFEALLRERRVVCWGRPFYAGWGLTHDAVPHERRRVARTLDELVAATLLRYPLYLDPASGAPCRAEEAVDALVRWRARQPHLPAWRRWLRPVLARLR